MSVASVGSFGSAYSASNQQRPCHLPPHLRVWTGHEWQDQTYIIERFLMQLFGCSAYIAEPISGMPCARQRLRDYIANVLAASQMHKYVWGAVMFLNRVKERYPEKSYPNGHEVFVAALMLSTKVFLDFSPNRWVEWARGIPKKRLFQVERELCADLDWDFSCQAIQLTSFKRMTCRDFGDNNSGCNVTWLFVTTNRRPEPPKPQPTVEWDQTANYHSQQRAMRPRLPVGPLPQPTVTAPGYLYPHFMHAYYAHPYFQYGCPPLWVQ